jgi:hypothetical protein
MGIWEAMEKLSELVDDSDPDVGVFILLLPPLFPSVLPFPRAALALVRVALFSSRATPPSHQRR